MKNWGWPRSSYHSNIGQELPMKESRDHLHWIKSERVSYTAIQTVWCSLLISAAISWPRCLSDSRVAKDICLCDVLHYCATDLTGLAKEGYNIRREDKAEQQEQVTNSRWSGTAQLRESGINCSMRELPVLPITSHQFPSLFSSLWT